MDSSKSASKRREESQSLVIEIAPVDSCHAHGICLLEHPSLANHLLIATTEYDRNGLLLYEYNIKTEKSQRIQQRIRNSNNLPTKISYPKLLKSVKANTCIVTARCQNSEHSDGYFYGRFNTKTRKWETINHSYPFLRSQTFEERQQLRRTSTNFFRVARWIL